MLRVIKTKNYFAPSAPVIFGMPIGMHCDYIVLICNIVYGSADLLSSTDSHQGILNTVLTRTGSLST